MSDIEGLNFGGPVSGDDFFAESGLDAAVIPLTSLPYGQELDTAVSSMIAEDPFGQSLTIRQLVRAATGESHLPTSEFGTFLTTVWADERIRKIGKGLYQVGVGNGSEFSPEATPPNTANGFGQLGELNGHSEDTFSAGSLSLEGMLKEWRREAPRQQRKPFSRRRNHYHVYSDMGN